MSILGVSSSLILFAHRYGAGIHPTPANRECCLPPHSQIIPPGYCLAVLIIPTKVKCTDTSNHPWAALDRKHSLSPGCSVTLSHGGASWRETRMCHPARGMLEPQRCSPWRKTTGQPRPPQESPCCDPPTHSHIGFSSVWCRPNQRWQSQNHLGWRRPLRSSTPSINLTQWALLLPWCHITTTCQPFPGGRQAPNSAVTTLRAGKSPCQNHDEVTAKHLFISPCFSCLKGHGSECIYPHMKAHSAEFNWIHSKILSLFLHQ